MSRQITLEIVTDRLEIVVSFEGGPEESADVCVGADPNKSLCITTVWSQNTWHL